MHAADASEGTKVGAPSPSFPRIVMTQCATTNNENNSSAGSLPVGLRLFSWESGNPVLLDIRGESHHHKRLRHGAFLCPLTSKLDTFDFQGGHFAVELSSVDWQISISALI